MNNMNPLAMAIVLVMAIALGVCVWRCLRPKKSNTGACHCGKSVTMIAGRCPCGGSSFEKNREQSFN